MKVTLKRAECIHCGACAAACASVFEMDDDNTSALKGVAVSDVQETETEEACAKEAAAGCPAQCITVS